MEKSSSGTILDWITAEQIWEHILATDPYRMEDIDQYSNMLFVMKKKDKLFKIAHGFMEVEEARPEVQTLIGVPLDWFCFIYLLLHRKLLQHYG
jgi:hypothetical protein